MKSAFDILNKYKAKMTSEDYNELLSIMVEHFGEAVEEQVEIRTKTEAQLYNAPAILKGAYQSFGQEYASKTTQGEKDIAYNKWLARGLSSGILDKIRKVV